MNPPFSLVTDRLALRHSHAGDDRFILELVNDPEWLRFIGDRGIRTPAEARVYIEEKLQAHQTHHGFAMAVIERLEDREPVGLAGFVQRNFLPHPDIGYALLSAHAGRGYATEICRALVTYGREELGFTTILGLTGVDNTRSIAVLRKLGLRHLRTEQFPGWNEPSVIYTT